MTDREVLYLETLQLFNRTNFVYQEDFSSLPMTPENRNYLIALVELADTGFLTREYHNENDILGYRINSNTIGLISSLNQTKREELVHELEVKNLGLQNKHLKRTVLYSVISFLSGAVVTNVTPILGWLGKLFQQ